MKVKKDTSLSDLRSDKIFKNIESVLLAAFLLLVPTQLGKHFWISESYVLGIRIDYLSPTLYLVDVVWGLWIVTKIFKVKIPPLTLPLTREGAMRLLGGVGIGVLVVINVLVAGSKWIAIYKWAKLGQILLTIKLIQGSRFKVQSWLRWVIPVWLVAEVGLGLGQIINGGSLGGWWYWLGERRFDWWTPGIAKVAWEGQEWLRAYGTFSHPNSLAGFLLVTILIWQWLGKEKGWKYWAVWWVGVLGIVVTGSRMAGMLLIFNFEFSIFYKLIKEKIGYKKIGWVVVGVGVILGLTGLAEKMGGWDAEGWIKRWQLAEATGTMIKDNWVVGVGLGNYISKLPDYMVNRSIFWLQPVHNIPLLWMAETGIVGTIILILNFEFSIFKRDVFWWKLAIVVVVTGMADHYWVTLPQNMWLAAIGLGLIW